MNIVKKKTALVQFLRTASLIRWALLFLVMLVFLIILTPNLLVTEYAYRLGDVAEKNVKAPVSFFVEDSDATAKKQQQAGREILTVYDYDAALPARVGDNVHSAFESLRAELAATPVPAPSESDATTGDADTAAHDRVWQLKAHFEKKMGISVSSGAYKILEKEAFSREIETLILRIIREILDNGVVANKEGLLREADRGISLKTVGADEEQVVRNLKKFYGLDQAKTMVRIVAQPLVRDFNYTVINLIVDLAQRLLQPNITPNRSETEARRKKVMAAIKPVLYQIKAGEMLLREGERVTDLQVLKLKTLRKQTRNEKRYARSLGAMLLIFCLLMTTWFLHIRRRGQRVFRTNRDVLFMAVLLILFFFVPSISQVLSESLGRHLPFRLSDFATVFGIPLSAGTMTVCLFMGFEVAVTFSLILAACTTVILQSGFEVFIFFFLSGIMGGYWMQSCRERKVFIKAGLKIGGLNIFFSTAVAVYMGDFGGFTLISHWAFALMGGIGAGIITAGIVPLLEMTFHYTTDITLLELANLERPILRKLMIEAPGTYHHSVVVGSMVEAAAAEICANPLLAKVCGYYHDIGKVKKPIYFIENQQNGRNRHDRLAPSMSSLILISHVKEGVEIARQHRLGQEITDAIRQHHGTSTIRYFFEKARQQKGANAVRIENYQYPGPKPQTREIALIMLADVVEAASRTLDNPTPSRIRGLVERLIDKIFSDGQLDNCELTLKDLRKIKESYIKILNGIHHHRIEYPDQNAVKTGKEKDGSTDRQQTGVPNPAGGKDSEDSPDHLKRTGMPRR